MKRPIIVLMAMSAALFALPTGCNKNPTPEANAPLPPPTPATVVARLTQPDSAAILPHKIESATAFPQALSSLAPDVTAPQVAPPTAESPAVDPNGPPSKGLTADGVTVDL
ncbi:MAG: hypothetical protein ABSE59_03905, partial [Opitutaceae bacterium]